MDNAINEQSISPGHVGAADTPRRHLEVWLPVIIVAVDQATKALVKERLAFQDSVTIIPGFVNFTHVLNSGAAFGILIGVGLYAASISHHQLAARVGLALIIGGAAGNLIDRVLFGSVVDFVDVYWRSYHFWAFNVADSAISVGVAIMILDMLGVHNRRAGL
jgi:signal peptidase II